MGNQSSASLSQYGDMQNPTQNSILSKKNNHWVKVASLGFCDIVKEKRSQKIGQAYIAPVMDFNNQLAVYQFRKNEPQNIVSVYFVEKHKDQVFCGNFQNIRIITQRIPYRLADLGNLGYAEGLYIMQSILRGVQKIEDEYFRAFGKNERQLNFQQNMICFNQKGEVKIWINKNISINTPEWRPNKNNGLLAQIKYEEQTSAMLMQIVEKRMSGKKFIQYQKKKNENEGYLTSFRACIDFMQQMRRIQQQNSGNSINYVMLPSMILNQNECISSQRSGSGPKRTRIFSKSCNKDKQQEQEVIIVNQSLYTTGQHQTQGRDINLSKPPKPPKSKQKILREQSNTKSNNKKNNNNINNEKIHIQSPRQYYIPIEHQPHHSNSLQKLKNREEDIVVKYIQKQKRISTPMHKQHNLPIIYNKNGHKEGNLWEEQGRKEQQNNRNYRMVIKHSERPKITMNGMELQSQNSKQQPILKTDHNTIKTQQQDNIKTTQKQQITENMNEQKSNTDDKKDLQLGIQSTINTNTQNKTNYQNKHTCIDNLLAYHQQYQQNHIPLTKCINQSQQKRDHHILPSATNERRTTSYTPVQKPKIVFSFGANPQ